MLRLVLACLLFLGLAEVAAAQNCKKGIPCGRSCIAASKTCRIGAPAPVSAPAREREPTVADVERHLQGDTSIPAMRSLVSRSAGTRPTSSILHAAFVGSARGNLYYPLECALAADIPEALRVYFHTAEGAELLRYSRATACARE